MFVIFVGFWALRSADPLFLLSECESSFSPSFVKTPCFRQGKKHRFQKYRFHNPDKKHLNGM